MPIEKIALPEQHYLYVERTCAMDGPSIASAMESGFGEIFTFAGTKGITPLSMPSAIYLQMPCDGKMTFRAALFIQPDDKRHATDAIKAATIEAGAAYKATHTGSYQTLGDTHSAIWDLIKSEGHTDYMPQWEIYVDDPTLKPEHEVRTECYCRVG